MHQPKVKEFFLVNIPNGRDLAVFIMDDAKATPMAFSNGEEVELTPAEKEYITTHIVWHKEVLGVGTSGLPK